MLFNSIVFAAVFFGTFGKAVNIDRPFYITMVTDTTPSISLKAVYGGGYFQGSPSATQEELSTFTIFNGQLRSLWRGIEGYLHAVPGEDFYELIQNNRGGSDFDISGNKLINTKGKKSYYGCPWGEEDLKVYYNQRSRCVPIEFFIEYVDSVPNTNTSTTTTSSSTTTTSSSTTTPPGAFVTITTDTTITVTSCEGTVVSCPARVSVFPVVITSPVGVTAPKVSDSETSTILTTGTSNSSYTTATPSKSVTTVNDATKIAGGAGAFAVILAALLV